MTAQQGGDCNGDDIGMRQGVAAVAKVMAARERVAAEVATSTTVGPLPQLLLRSHSRESSLLSIFK